jgi:hypothetical protein
MEKTIEEDTTLSSLSAEWKYDLLLANCPLCDWTFLLEKGVTTKRCPHCFRDSLIPVQDSASQLPYLKPPELVLPATQSPRTIFQSLESFIKKIPYAPAGLAPDILLERMEKIYLPTWLVDPDVEAVWRAEVGFNYEVVSHQDRYQDHIGGWTSSEVNEQRVRWEPRVGRLKREYSNVPAPALEDGRELTSFVDDFDLNQAREYSQEYVKDGLVRVPTRLPQDAWTEALPKIQSEARRECQEAAGADHIREFQWTPEFPKRDWTLLLRPVFTTFYFDDAGEIQVVYINAGNGSISGAQRASMKRAQRTARIVFAIALLGFLISLIIAAIGLVNPILLTLSGVGLTLSALIGLGAFIPIAIVWQFNRVQRSP